ADERDYGVAAHMLRSLEVRSILLMSNNPAKAKDLAARGIRVEGRIPITVPPNPYNARYLETKRVKGGHLLEPAGKGLLDEQMDSLRAGEVSDSGK
ncbi:GTP cyclohydrolase II, partial [mine drainage metagenome]